MRTRTQRRLEEREAMKRGERPTPSGNDEREQRQHARRQTLSIGLLLFFCSSLAFVIGGKLWIDTPRWLWLIGWTIIAVALLGGLRLWIKERKYFGKTKWMWRALIVILASLTLSYMFSVSIRDATISLRLHTIETNYAPLIKVTSEWRNTAWSQETCRKNMAMHPKLIQDVLYRNTPPSSEEFSMLMAINQVAYIAGCDIDFNAQSKQLLDPKKTWQKTAPWQYASLRQWANRSGWPRKSEGCRWEVARAELQGNPEVIKQMTMWCEKWQTDKLTAWNGGKSLVMVEEQVKREEKSLRDQIEVQ